MFFLFGLVILIGFFLGLMFVIKLDMFMLGLLVLLLMSNFLLWIDLMDFYDIDFLKMMFMFMLGGVVIKFVFVLG